MFDFHTHLTFKPYNSVSIYNKTGTRPDSELWRERFRPPQNLSDLRGLEKELNFTSHTHLNALADGEVTVVCNSLYPLERVFTKAFEKLDDSIFYDILEQVVEPPILKLITNIILKEAHKGIRKEFFKLVGSLTGYDEDVIERINNGNYHYYNQLVEEYQYLKTNQNNKGSQGQGKIAYEIAKDYADIERIYSEGKISVLVSIEGANAFLGRTDEFESLKAKESTNLSVEIKDYFVSRITDFKRLVPELFVVTLAHHQYNFLCGHAPSFVGIAKAAFNQEGTVVDHQSPQGVHYFDLGLRPIAKDIIDLLLSKNIGSRALIDTKHLSAQARVEYHQMVKQRNQAGDKLPIVQTHTAVNGRPSFKNLKARPRNSVEQELELRKRSERKKYPFNTGSINLFDDEILDIVQSDGMMGIMLDEKRLVGDALPADAALLALDLPHKKRIAGAKNPEVLRRDKLPENRLSYNKWLYKGKLFKLVKKKCELAILQERNPSDNSKKVRQLKSDIDKLSAQVEKQMEKVKPVFLSILMNQFLHIVKVVCDNHIQIGVAPNKGWDHLCIGTDYEGVINPLDIYFYASDLRDLRKDLVDFWIKCISDKRSQFDIYRSYLFGLQPHQYIHAIIWGNARRFLSDYFTDFYRKN